MSDRVYEILRRRCRDKQGVEKKEGWVFPARRKNAKLPHLDSISAHFAMACGQRGWKRQPAGGLSGLGTSPASRMRARFAVGSGTGTADSNAWV